MSEPLSTSSSVQLEPAACPSGRRAKWLPGGPALVPLVLLGIYFLLAVGVCRGLGPTSDEKAYILFGRCLLSGRHWDNVHLQTQGPLPLLLSQVGLLGFTNEELALGAEEAPVLSRARLALLPLGLLAGLGCYLWSREAFGRRGGLLTLALFSLNPLMIGYASLVTVDMAHAAFLVWAGYFTWRLCIGRSVVNLLAAGVALGLALGSKYTASLVAPLIALAAAGALFRRMAGDRGPALAAAGAFGGLLLLAGTSLLTLHACYGFEPPFASADGVEYRSGLVLSLLESPVGSLFGLLPRPWLLGIDDQFLRGHGGHAVYLNGVFEVGHEDYYLWAFLLKTPIVALVLLGLVLGFQGPRWLSRRSAPRERTTALVLGGLILLPAAYLSFFTTYSVGIRFALFLYPFLFVLLGSAARLSLPRWTGGGGDSNRRAALGGGLVLLASLPALTGYPNLIAYFNGLGGGPAKAREHFRDSNADWGQMVKEGAKRLSQAEQEPFQVLTGGQGPRFGRVALYLQDLVRPDPENPARARHWTDVFEPVRNVGSSWWLFDASRPAFERAVEQTGSARVRSEFCVALLAEGFLDAAADQLALLPASRAEPLASLFELLQHPALRAGDGGSEDPALLLRLGLLWEKVGRPELAVQAIGGRTDSLEMVQLRVRGLVVLDRRDEAIEVLEQEGLVAAHPLLALRLTRLYLDKYRLVDGLELLERYRDELRELAPGRYKSLHVTAAYFHAAVPKWTYQVFEGR